VEEYPTVENIGKKTQGWLREIAAFNEHEMRVNRQKAALLVIDMQRFFIDPTVSGFLQTGLVIVPNVTRVIAAFREAGRPVIFTRHVHHPDGHDLGIMGWWWKGACREGSPESEIYAKIAPLPGEKVILKHRYSAFYNTDLETVLRGLKIEDLVICGVLTNLCCESTARDAYFRDYRVFFLADSTATITEEMHTASLLNLAYGFAFVTTADDVTNRLRK
jgi:nicotinamidase-related amidase